MFWHFSTLIPPFHFIILWLVPLHHKPLHPCADEVERLRYFHQRVATATIKLQLASRNSLIWTEGLIQISQMGSRLHDNYCDTPTLPLRGQQGTPSDFVATFAGPFPVFWRFPLCFHCLLIFWAVAAAAAATDRRTDAAACERLG